MYSVLEDLLNAKRACKEAARVEQDKSKWLIFPKEATPEIAKLLDEACKKDNLHYGKYQLWSKISEYFPEAVEKNFVINSSNPIQYYLQPVLDEDDEKENVVEGQENDIDYSASKDHQENQNSGFEENLESSIFVKDTKRNQNPENQGAN